jgi:hypothetical protein
VLFSVARGALHSFEKVRFRTEMRVVAALSGCTVRHLCSASALFCLIAYNPMGYSLVQTVVETPVFFRRAGKLLGEEAHNDLIAYLAMHPPAGDEIVGTGGVRKVRFAGKGKGKSGGVRVIYYFYDREIPIYALLIYAKNERADLTAEQRKSVASFAAAIKALGNANEQAG